MLKYSSLLLLRTLRACDSSFKGIGTPSNVDPVISKALYFRCCAGCCIIDLFRVYDFRCCLHKTVLDFRINREWWALNKINSWSMKNLQWSGVFVDIIFIKRYGLQL